MRVCAEFEDHYTALAAHRHLIDEGLESQEIEIRSPYPLPEHPIPPHRSGPMYLRPAARFMWACAILAGFSFVTFTQYEWAPVSVTNGHPLIPIPITMIVTYECGMITAILTTTFMFFLETFRFRQLVPALEEDMPVATGYVALVVGGKSADRAMKLLEGQGARSVVSYLIMFMMMAFLTGCSQFNMRKQDVIKATEAAAEFQPAFSVRMPDANEQAVAPPAAIGYEVTGDQTLFNDYRSNLAKMQFDKSDTAKKELPETQKRFAEAAAKMAATDSMPKMYALKDHVGDVDKAIAPWVNPVKPTAEALDRGEKLFTTNCAQCHGLKGQGDGKVGEVCAPKPPAIGTKYNNYNKPDGYFYFRIYSGQNQMPPFGYKLTPEEISSIILHLRRLQSGS